MIIPFQKRRNQFDLLLSTLWGSFGILGLTLSSGNDWLYYVMLTISAGYLVFFLFDKRVRYLKIGNGYMKETGFLRKKINLEEVIHFEEVQSQIILKDQKNEIKINTTLLDEEEISGLYQVLGEYEMGLKKGTVC